MKKTISIGVFMTAMLIYACSPDDPAPKIEIGKNYEGGIIFYVDETGQHGLVAAPHDQSLASAWWNGNYGVINAKGSAMGTGQANTIAIIEAQGVGVYAASICDQLELNGYDDWFLPSKNELNAVYNNLHIQGFGEFAKDLYWSSTQFNEATAWYQDFNDCCPGWNDEKVMYHVRAVRVF
jgi:hypothetical protein